MFPALDSLPCYSSLRLTDLLLIPTAAVALVLFVSSARFLAQVQRR